MFKHILANGASGNEFPIIILLIFFSFFVGVILLAFFSSKEYINHMSALPLEDDEKFVNQSSKGV